VLGVVIWLSKETKGLSLEQIDILWVSEEYKATNGEPQIIEGIAAEKVVERGVDKGEYVGTVLGFLAYMRPTWIEEFERLVCVRLLYALTDGCIEYLFQDLGCRRAHIFSYRKGILR
jgi:hypothetical protein